MAPRTPEDPSKVLVKYELRVTPKEAHALFAACPGGKLPSEFPLGVGQELGKALWGVMKHHGLLSTTGTGHGTIARPDPHLFDQVRFVLQQTRRSREKRWDNTKKKEHRAPGVWFQELGQALGGRARPPAQSSQAVPPAAAAVEAGAGTEPALDFEPVKRIIQGQIELLEGEVARFDKEYEEDLRPRLERREAAHEKLRQARETLAMLERAELLLRKAASEPD